jgi:hypothetical protein
LSLEERWRRDGGEMEERWRRDGGEMEERWRRDGGEMEEMEKSAPLLPISRVDRLGGD